MKLTPRIRKGITALARGEVGESRVQIEWIERDLRNADGTRYTGRNIAIAHKNVDSGGSFPISCFKGDIEASPDGSVIIDIQVNVWGEDGWTLDGGDCFNVHITKDGVVTKFSQEAP
jgi:hypothetical protein